MNIPKREQGQGLVEYALVLVLVAIVVIITLQLLGSAVTVVFVRVVGGLNGQTLSGTGTEYMVSGANVNTVDLGAGSCTVTVSGVTVVAFNNGSTMGDTSISIPMTMTGGSTVTLSGTTDSNGVLSNLGGSSSASCPGTLTIGSYSTSY